ncbi:hypothetical protein N7510_002063 [Penicillium lagena]|uniref:uncharacterized protein n=1 Tax=Penicillium lagena TaxID=94218 RepID=UPI0025408104|nr:uncharacterized protein N7510_002063 [Penicillium lagena]KAJ5625754.1 hypothetical protein N7510_002063 [Penicillium lagena]
MGEDHTEDNDGGGSVSHLLILRPTELNHALGRGVRHLDLSQNGVSVIGQYNTPHGVQEHLQHRFGTET